MLQSEICFRRSKTISTPGRGFLSNLTRTSDWTGCTENTHMKREFGEALSSQYHCLGPSASVIVCFCFVCQSGAAGRHRGFNRKEKMSAVTGRETRAPGLHCRADIRSGQYHTHTHYKSHPVHDNKHVCVCLCVESRRAERRERQTVCVGDGDRGSRYSVGQFILYAAVTQAESRRRAEDPAGNTHRFRSEHTHTCI